VWQHENLPERGILEEEMLSDKNVLLSASYALGVTSIDPSLAELDSGGFGVSVASNFRNTNW